MGRGAGQSARAAHHPGTGEQVRAQAWARQLNERADQPLSRSKEGEVMKIGMIGLGRMGANMVRRLLKGGHECVVFDRSPATVKEIAQAGAIGAASLADFAGKLARPRSVWLMIPAAAVDHTIADLLPHLEPGDTVIDGGNSYYVDDIRRSRELLVRKITYL